MRRALEDRERRAVSKPVGALVLLLVMVALLTACGVTLSSGQSKTEFFKQLTLTGTLSTGNELTLGVDYAQPYPTEVEMVCDLLTTAKPTPTAHLPPTATPRPGVPRTPAPIPKPVPTPKNVVLQILRFTVGANNNGGSADEATPVLASTSGKFRAPDTPGRYTILCYTPADLDNRITKTIRIDAAATP